MAATRQSFDYCLYSRMQRFGQPTYFVVCSRTNSFVLCAAYDMRRGFVYHLYSKACIHFSTLAVGVQLMQPRRRMETLSFYITLFSLGR